MKHDLNNITTLTECFNYVMYSNIQFYIQNAKRMIEANLRPKCSAGTHKHIIKP